MISLPISELLFSRARVGEKAAKRKREGKRRRRGSGGGCRFAWRNPSKAKLVNGPIDGITIKIL